MAVNVVIVGNLGAEFDIGVLEPNKIHVRPGPGIVHGPAFIDLRADIPTILAATTNDLSTPGGAVLTSTVNGVADSLNLTPLIQAGETTTTLTYNGLTGDLTYTDEDGVATVINLPVENFLASASYNSTTNILTLTLVDSSVVNVDLTDIIGTGNLTSTTDVLTVTGGANSTVANVSIAVADMVGATNLLPGLHGLVPTPSAGEQDDVLTGDGTWRTVASLMPPTTNTLVFTGPNTLTSTVNGVAAAASPVATVSNAVAGTNLTTTVNGVVGAPTDLTPVLYSALTVDVQDAFAVHQFFALP